MIVARDSRRRPRRERRAASAIELAIILPLLMTIALGCVDFGRFAYTYIAVTNAAREGAAYGSTTPFVPSGGQNANQLAWRTALEVRIAEEIDGVPGFDASQITVQYTDPIITEENGRRRLRITVSYPFQTIVNWPPIPNTVLLTRTVEMRLIR